MSKNQIKAIIELLRAMGHSDKEIMSECKEIYDALDKNVYDEQSYKHELDIMIQSIMAVLDNDER